MTSQFFVKLRKGHTHVCPDGTVITAKKAKPCASNSSLLAYARNNPRRFHVVEDRPSQPRRRVQRRGRSDLPAEIEANVIEFGASLGRIAALARPAMIERIATYKLDVKVKGKNAALAQAIFDEEQAMLREPEDDEDEPEEKRVRKPAATSEAPATSERRRRRRRSADADADDDDDDGSETDDDDDDENTGG